MLYIRLNNVQKSIDIALQNIFYNGYAIHNIYYLIFFRYNTVKVFNKKVLLVYQDNIE